MSNAAPSARHLTSKQAKKQYQKNGQQIPERERRQLDRAIELDKRAERVREAEKRRKFAQQKRAEREEKERDATRQTGIGRATQACGFRNTQKGMKKGMEAFLGMGISGPQRLHDVHEQKEPDEAASIPIDNAASECWDEEDTLFDDFGSSDPIEPETEKEQDPWDAEDVDDDTLVDVLQENTVKEVPKAEHPPMSPPRPPLGDINANTVSHKKPFSERQEPLEKSPSLQPKRASIRNASKRGSAQPVRESHPVPRTATDFLRASLHSTINPQSTLDQSQANFTELWDDFLCSSTQIAREIAPVKKSVPNDEYTDFPISTQDLQLSQEDFDDMSFKRASPVERTAPARPPLPPCGRPPAQISPQTVLGKAERDNGPAVSDVRYSATNASNPKRPSTNPMMMPPPPKRFKPLPKSPQEDIALSDHPLPEIPSTPPPCTQSCDSCERCVDHLSKCSGCKTCSNGQTLNQEEGIQRELSASFNLEERRKTPQDSGKSMKMLPPDKLDKIPQPDFGLSTQDLHSFIDDSSFDSSPLETRKPPVPRATSLERSNSGIDDLLLLAEGFFDDDFG